MNWNWRNEVNIYILYIYSRFLVKYDYFEIHEINLTNELNSNLVEIFVPDYITNLKYKQIKIYTQF